ncbi:MAG: hypothetical protein K0U12_02005, partial [Gammaproteobacteria bacterium]|nr:hypothetical protein [Gammaproteobacteria bacterium]
MEHYNTEQPHEALNNKLPHYFS